jgi:hypothetical protein
MAVFSCKCKPFGFVTTHLFLEYMNIKFNEVIEITKNAFEECAGSHWTTSNIFWIHIFLSKMAEPNQYDCKHLIDIKINIALTGIKYRDCSMHNIKMDLR